VQNRGEKQQRCCFSPHHNPTSCEERGKPMKELKLQLIERALEEHQVIFPCTSRGELEECFTETDNKLLFWFNTQDHSTHLIMHDLKPTPMYQHVYTLGTS
jgi:hypothetical protein